MKMISLKVGEQVYSIRKKDISVISCHTEKYSDNVNSIVIRFKNSDKKEMLAFKANFKMDDICDKVVYEKVNCSRVIGFFNDLIDGEEPTIGCKPKHGVYSFLEVVKTCAEE